MNMDFNTWSLKKWTYQLHLRNPRTLALNPSFGWPVTDAKMLCYYLAKDYYGGSRPLDLADAWRWVSAYFWAHGASVDGREAWAYVNSSGTIEWPRVMERLRLVDSGAGRHWVPEWIFEDPEDYYYDYEPPHDSPCALHELLCKIEENEA